MLFAKRKHLNDHVEMMASPFHPFFRIKKSEKIERVRVSSKVCACMWERERHAHMQKCVSVKAGVCMLVCVCVYLRERESERERDTSPTHCKKPFLDE